MYKQYEHFTVGLADPTWNPYGSIVKVEGDILWSLSEVPCHSPASLVANLSLTWQSNDPFIKIPGWVHEWFKSPLRWEQSAQLSDPAPTGFSLSFAHGFSRSSQAILSIRLVTPALPLNHHPTKQINDSLPFSLIHSVPPHINSFWTADFSIMQWSKHKQTQRDLLEDVVSHNSLFITVLYD